MAGRGSGQGSIFVPVMHSALKSYDVLIVAGWAILTKRLMSLQTQQRDQD